MKSAIRATLVVLRLTGLVQLILGVVFWTGHALSLIPFHMLTGSVFVLALWALAGLAARAGAPAGLAALAVVWGLVVPALGFTQAQLLPACARGRTDNLSVHPQRGTRFVPRAPRVVALQARRPHSTGLFLVPPAASRHVP